MNETPNRAHLGWLCRDGTTLTPASIPTGFGEGGPLVKASEPTFYESQEAFVEALTAALDATSFRFVVSLTDDGWLITAEPR